MHKTRVFFLAVKRNKQNKRSAHRARGISQGKECLLLCLYLFWPPEKTVLRRALIGSLYLPLYPSGHKYCGIPITFIYTRDSAHKNY